MHGRAGHGLEELVDLFPGELADDDVRDRLKHFARDLDQLTALDESGEVVVDRDTFERVVTGGTFPHDLHQRIRRDAHGHLEARLRSRPNGRKLRWLELAEHDAPIKPTSVDQLRQFGIDRGTSVERAKTILQEQYPDVPADVLAADGPELRDLGLRALQHNRSVWDCCVAHLGWWGALWVFAAVGALLIVGTATGPWGIPLAIWLIGVLGGGTAVIVMNCVLNPDM